jgi:hypothetical protein
MFRGKEIRHLGFFRRGDFIGEGAASGGRLRALTIGGRDQGLGHAPLWCAWPLGPLRLIFGLREYFLCNFFETQKQKKKNRELALWHLVNRLVPENA